jgi:integrase
MDRISTFDIEKLLSVMKRKELESATLLQIIVLLSHMFSLSKRWSIYNGNNPCDLVHRPKINNQITEFLTDDQQARLLETLNIWSDRMTASIVRFAMLTGVRRGELFKLRWQDIDLEHGTMLLRDPKGMKDVSLPLSKEALLVIQAVPKEYDMDYVFYSKDGKQLTDIKRSWHAIRKAAGLPDDFRFHGLRHHFASSLVSNGVDLYIVQQLLTHKSHAMTQRYSHLSPNALKQATEKAGKLLTGQAPEPDNKVVSLASVSGNTK